MLLPQSAQWLRDGPCDRRLFARSIASFTVASICSCTAPSPAQPVAIPVLSDYRISFLNNYHWVRLQVTAGRPSYRDVPPGAMVTWPPEPGPPPRGLRGSGTVSANRPGWTLNRPQTRSRPNHLRSRTRIPRRLKSRRLPQRFPRWARGMPPEDRGHLELPGLLRWIGSLRATRLAPGEQVCQVAGFRA